MRPTGIIANLAVPDIAEAREFYSDFLGVSTSMARRVRVVIDASG